MTSVTSAKSLSNSPPRRNSRMELHKFSIPERPRGTSPRKNGGINLSLDLERSPDTTSNGHSVSGTNDNEELLYALASKKRQISELEHALKIAQQDLTELEERWKLHTASKQPATSALQNWHNKLQKTVEEGGILQSLVNKFTELTHSDDHNEYSYLKTDHENFYLKNKFDYDEDEEVAEEETGKTLLQGKERSICR